MAIDFTLSAEQRELQTGARDFAARVLRKVGPKIKEIAKAEDRFYSLRPFYDEMVSAGYAKALFPTDLGGTAVSALDFAIAAEELAGVDVNVPNALLATGLALQPVIRHGTAAQKKRLLSPFLEDGSRLAAFAFTEVGGGANFDNPDPSVGLKTVARKEGNEWVINGQKHYTVNGSGWDGKGAYLYAVVCRTDLSKPPEESMALIFVPGTAPGIKIVDVYETVGHRAVNCPRIHFENVRVPADNLIGKPGDGVEMAYQSFAWTAALIGAACVGVMRSAFETAMNFARTDKRNGSVAVIEHQNAGYMLADMKMRIEAGRYLAWKACHQFDISNGRSKELAVIAKVYCSELCVQVVYDAMRLVGIDSYTDMHPLAAKLQDALCFPLYDGGNMGVRRRELHNLFRSQAYDGMASAEGRFTEVMKI
jgi:nitroalkane oxidase